MILTTLLMLLQANHEYIGKSQNAARQAQPSDRYSGNNSLSDPSYISYAQSRQSMKKCLIEKSSGRPRCKTELEWARLAKKLEHQGR